MFSRKKSHSEKKTAQPVVKPVIPEPTYAPEPVVQQTYEAPAPQVQQLPDLDSSDAILAAQGAALQNHNRDLVKRLSELKDKRDELDNAINNEEAEKDKYEDHLRALQDRLQEVVEGLHKKMNVKSEVERVIVETESAYNKLVESSHSLLGLLERETLNIQKERKTEVEHLM